MQLIDAIRILLDSVSDVDMDLFTKDGLSLKEAQDTCEQFINELNRPRYSEMSNKMFLYLLSKELIQRHENIYWNLGGNGNDINFIKVKPQLEELSNFLETFLSEEEINDHK